MSTSMRLEPTPVCALYTLDERHFRRALREFVDHNDRERSHQGLEKRLIEGARLCRRAGRIRRPPRLDGLLNCYERAA